MLRISWSVFPWKIYCINYGFYSYNILESHMKYTRWHSNVITIHVGRLSTNIFCITNEWKGRASGQSLEVCMIWHHYKTSYCYAMCSWAGWKGLGRGYPQYKSRKVNIHFYNLQEKWGKWEDGVRFYIKQVDIQKYVMYRQMYALHMRLSKLPSNLIEKFF